jgi:hypothetical protein
MISLWRNCQFSKATALFCIPIRGCVQGLNSSPFEFKGRVLCLLGSYSTTWAIDPALKRATICFSFFKLVGLGFEYRVSRLQSGALPFGQRLSPFYSGYFGDDVSWTICPVWPWTVILPISVSQIARITCVSHWCLTLANIFYHLYFIICPRSWVIWIDFHR